MEPGALTEEKVIGTCVTRSVSLDNFGFQKEAVGDRQLKQVAFLVMDHQPVVPLDQSFDAVLGLELLPSDGETARAQVEVSDRLKQPMGIVHGGVYASIAESLASMATYQLIGSEGKIAVGLSNHTSFLRPVMEGHIHASAVPRHRGRRTWVWEVDLKDDNGKLCAASRVTLAVQEISSWQA